MKIVVYLDDNHNSVEVKDKIRSVFPDAKYMIFDAGELKKKPTNFQNIKAMGLEEMAEFLNELNYQTQCKIPTSCLANECNDCIKQWLETEVEE